MRIAARRLLFALALPAPLAAQRAAAAPPSPASVLGFVPGADRRLAAWSDIVGYFAKLAAASPQVKLDTLGSTTQARPFIMATISSATNIGRLGQIRQRQAELADPRTLTPARERAAYARQPAVILISCNIHSNEIASSQMAMTLAYRLATVDTLRRMLDSVVVLLIPSMNPDGEEMITSWYRDGLGTRWEGGPMPWLYHPYAGHDDNRDWYMVNLKETALVTDLLYRRWFPEVFYDVHQMGNEGARLFVPPFMDPVDPNIDPLIVRAIGQIGGEMALALESRGKTGVLDHAIYDLWWDGGARSTPTRHNIVGLLTEAASVKIATPITQTLADLKGHERGLPTYQAGVTFPHPWLGGEWHLGDIVEYERIAAESLLRLAWRERERYVRNFVTLGRHQIELGRSDTVKAYEIPFAQYDPYSAAQLVRVLRAGAVEVGHTDSSWVVRFDQPYRAHAKDLLEPQQYPKRELWPGGPPEPPYDITGWTLPFQMGVRVRALTSLPAEHRISVGSARATADVGADTALPRGELVARNTGSYAVAARALARGERVLLHARSSSDRADTLTRLPRLALYRPWTGNIDEGWTRWVLERFGIPSVSVTDSVVRAGKLRDHFDVLLVPDMSLREIRDGMPPSAVPPRYAGGLGTAGLEAVKDFVIGGGTLVLLDHASELGTEVLGVPVRRITVSRATASERSGASLSGAASEEALYAPGSILRVLVDATSRVAIGMPDTAAVYFTNSVTFDVAAGTPVRVIARYPERGEDILLSGYLQGAQQIAGKAAAVEAPVGQGRVVMFGFRPQHRGQSYGTFRMLFNALLLGRDVAARN